MIKSDNHKSCKDCQISFASLSTNGDTCHHKDIDNILHYLRCHSLLNFQYTSIMMNVHNQIWLPPIY